MISYLRLGALRFVTLPGEFSPELVIGVPRDFDDPESVPKYFERPDLHPTGADFVLPGTTQGARSAECSASSELMLVNGQRVGRLRSGE